MWADSALLALWVPDWPVLAALQEEGLAEHEPVAITGSRAVIAVSAVSRARGVRRGMRLRTARSICPEVIFIAADPERDARVFELVLRAVDEVVVGGEVVRSGLVVFPARGALRHWGGPEVLAEQLTVSVARHTGWESSIGLGEGLLGAVSAARRSVLLAPGQTAEFLAPLPISELVIAGVAPAAFAGPLSELVDLLQRLGIGTLGQFAALRDSDVNARFGPVGRWAHRLVTNRERFRGVADRAPQEIEAALSLDPPAQRVDQTAFAARQVALELHEKLQREGLTCARLRITVRTASGSELQRTWRHEGRLTEREITERVRWQLEGWIATRARTTPRRGRFTDAHDPDDHEVNSRLDTDLAARPTSGPGSDPNLEPNLDPDLSFDPDAGLAHILLTALDPLDLAATDIAQGTLWGTTSKKDQNAQRSLTRVQHLLGPSGVLQPVLEGGRDPNTSSRLVAWGDAATSVRDPGLPWPGRLPQPAPTLVYPAPLGVEVVDFRGTAVTVSSRGELSAAPHRLISKQAQHPITGWAGPWIVAERWWEGRSPRARFQFLFADQRAVLAVCIREKWQIEASYD